MKTIMKKKDLGVKIIALIVSLLILAGSISGLVLFNAAAAPYSVTTPAATIIRELTSKRDLYSKQFLLSDGSFRAVTYGNPIHYKKGKSYKDINTSLITNNSNKKVKVTKAGRTTVQAAKKSNYKRTVAFKNSQTLSWKLINKNQKKKKAKITNPKKKNVTSIQNKSTVKYSNILKNVDLKYTIFPEKLEEELKIKKKTKINTFTYNYNYKKMTAKAKGGRVTFKRKGKIRLERKNIKISDAKGASTTNVKVSFKNGKLKVTPNKSWMKSKKRKYPVTIRTETLTHKYTNKVQVAGAYAGTPNKNHTSLPYLQVKANKCISFVKMGHRPALGANNVNIRSAYMTINSTANIQMHASKTFDVNVHRVSQAWSSSKVTDNNRPSYAEAASGQFKLRKKGKYSTDITDFVKNWYQGTPNRGVALVAANSNSGYLAKIDKEPSFTVNYEVVGFDGAVELFEDVPMQRTVSVSGKEDYFYFNPQPGIAYELYTTLDLDTQGLLYDGAKNRIGYNDDGGENKNFKFVRGYDGKTYLKINTKGKTMGNYVVTLKRRYTVPVLIGEQKSVNEFLLKWNAVQNAKEYVLNAYDKDGVIETKVVTGTEYTYLFTQETKGKILYFIVQPRESEALYGEISNRVYSESSNSDWVYKARALDKIRGYGATTVGTDIYTIGGWKQEETVTVANKDLMKYDTLKDEWTKVSTYPVEDGFLTNPAVVELDGMIYVIGGLNGTNNRATAITVMYGYDLQDGTWSKLADLPILDGEMSAVAYDGKIYCFSNPDETEMMATYNPKTDSWQTDVEVLKRSGVLLSTVVDHTMLVLKQGKGEIYFQEYDLLAGELTTKGEALRTDKTYSGIGTVSGTIYLQENGSNNVIYYDFYRDNWGEVSPMNIPKSDAKVLTVDTSLYSIGGVSDGFGELDVVESYPVPDLDVLSETIMATKGEVYELQLGMEKNILNHEITLKYDPEMLEIEKSSSFLLFDEIKKGNENITITKYDSDKGMIRFKFNVNEDEYFKGKHHSIPFESLGYGKTRVLMFADKK